MKTTAKRSFVLLFLVAAVITGLVVLSIRFVLYGKEWVMLEVNEHHSQDMHFVSSGNIVDRNGVILAYTENGERCYHESERIRRATLHIVGDPEGNIIAVQTAYKDELIGYNPVTGMYSYVKNGRGNDLVLTVDAEISAIAYDALNGRNGVVAAYNYETGEIICCVSSPNYDIHDQPSYDDVVANVDGKYEGLYMNKVISGLYTPGSTFKVITATCAIENIADIEKWEYTCTGSDNFSGSEKPVTCPESHGKMTFEECFSNSCNCAFAALAIELGEDKLMATATEYGFNTQYSFGSQLTQGSIIDLENTTDIQVGWTGVGQHETLVNPYHMLAVMGGIANGGEAVLPHVVSQIKSPDGDVIKTTEPQTVSYLPADVAADVSELMRYTVVNKYGDSNFKNLLMCGKTGTAEVGEGLKDHTWFVGFSQNSSCPVAIVVLVENSGGWGSSVALPIASDVMAEIYKTMA